MTHPLYSSPYLQVLLEIVLSLGLVKFIDFITALCGGQEAIVNFCTEKKILLPIGSPPIICLMPCRKPSVTLSRLSVVSFVPGLLFCYKVSILAIDVTLFLIGHQSSGEFFAYDNLHNIASFPVGLLSIYCYNMIISIMSECLPGNTKKFLGIIILIQFILFDCLRLFFIFLTGNLLFLVYLTSILTKPCVGTGMLTCVPPFLSQDLVSHILKNIIKAFLATFIGLPFFKIASGKTELTLVNQLIIHFHFMYLRFYFFSCAHLWITQMLSQVFLIPLLEETQESLDPKAEIYFR